jgi:hypothetical protein
MEPDEHVHVGIPSDDEGLEREADTMGAKAVTDSE